MEAAIDAFIEILPLSFLAGLVGWVLRSHDIRLAKAEDTIATMTMAIKELEIEIEKAKNELRKEMQSEPKKN